MNDSVRKINNLILEKYGEMCNVLRLEPKLTDVNTFGEWEEDQAQHWLNVVNNTEFATISIEECKDTAGVSYFAPVLIYSDGVDVVRESFKVE